MDSEATPLPTGPESQPVTLSRGELRQDGTQLTLQSAYVANREQLLDLLTRFCELFECTTVAVVQVDTQEDA